MKVIAVIPTYGNRAHILDKVINRLLSMSIDKILIVDNASENPIPQYDKTMVVRSITNTGSAGGYKIGLWYAVKMDCDYIWLLDDDNLPDEDALERLKENSEFNHACLVSNRVSRTLAGYRIDSVIGSKNAVLGLNLFNYKYTRANAKGWSGGYENKERFMSAKSKRSNKLQVAMYGGMFFHKSLIDKIGYPDERLFLYCDDYEWSHRIIETGGEIILVPSSKIKDIEETPGKKRSDDDFRVYYGTRNHVMFQKKFITNRFKFWVNYIAYLILLKLKRDTIKFNAVRAAVKIIKI